MRPASRFHGRGRELAVLIAGFAAAAALLWAGATVQRGLSTAGEVAVARLSGEVADVVVAEWERMLRESDPPVPPSGDVFRWVAEDGAGLADAIDGIQVIERGLDERGRAVVSSGPSFDSSEPTVLDTLLDEAERLELVEHDVEGALELVLEALEKDPGGSDPAWGWLRALQLGARLGRTDVVEAQWQRLRGLDLERGLPWAAMSESFVPLRVLAWLSLPAELRDATPADAILTTDERERLVPSADRIVLGSPEEPEARFELAPIVSVVCERMGLAPPPAERRRTAALARLGELPGVPADVMPSRWEFADFAGRPFVVRAEPGEPRGDGHGVRTTITGWFYAPRELEAALTERSGRPAGFRLDLDGDREDIGPAVRPRTALPYSDLAFTLRHEDPAALAREEAGRLGLLRTALVVLGLACAAGGLVTARVLARERRLAALRTAFVSGVSHDLRSPAAAILLLTENLESGAGDPARTHRALRREAARLRRLVDDVLDFARLERGETARLACEDVDLAGLVDGLERDLGARVAEAGRAFTVVRGELPESAPLDAEALRRALENLVENALKHGRGAVTLAVDADAGRVRFAVADEGPGVATGDRERVFEPFERVAANGHAGGTGLGLAIVRAIARGHGGEARVEGARFTLELPLEATEEDA